MSGHKRHLSFAFGITVCLVFLLVTAGCDFLGGSGGLGDDYVCQTTAADEDYVDFGSMEGFTASSDWSVIEKIKLPSDFSTPDRWHVFRGKAWEDKPGDLALRLDEDHVYGWLNVSNDIIGDWKSVNYDTTISLDVWYTICMQYDASEETLELYVNGDLKDSVTSVVLQDDSSNTNKLFFGGQDVDPILYSEGDLYHEADIVIAHHAWFQRLLTAGEISNYDGTLSSLNTADLFFATNIGDSGITDASGNGHNGIIGNTPEFYIDDL
jgi:hypothetical protein